MQPAKSVSARPLQDFPGRRDFADHEFMLTIAGASEPKLTERFNLSNLEVAYESLGFYDGGVPITVQMFVGAAHSARLRVSRAVALLVLGDACNTCNTARSVVWAYSLACLQAELGSKKTVGMLDILRRFRGMPTDVAHEACWNAQLLPDGRNQIWDALTAPITSPAELAGTPQ